MSRRRELKGIAKNFAKLLSGRNNDYLGYWAVGQLYSLAQESNVSLVVLDLMNFNSNIESPVFVSMCRSMRAELNRILGAHQVSSEWIKSISVEYHFDQEYQEKYHKWGSGWGKHYLVKLEIETDLGHINIAVEGGNVNPHDPAKEQRRNSV